jgi:hypothetical protein
MPPFVLICKPMFLCSVHTKCKHYDEIMYCTSITLSVYFVSEMKELFRLNLALEA